MAALNYRVNDVGAQRVVVVTDVGQEMHFKQLFGAGLKAGFYDPEKTRLDHMMFGMVLQVGEDGKASKIKTRSGESVKLYDLLDEAK